MTAYAAYLIIMGQSERALELLHNAKAQFPESDNVWAYVALASMHAGRIDEAMSLIDRIRADVNPNFELWRGAILARAGRIAEARAIADRADELAGTRYVLTYFRMRLRAQLGDFDQAFALIEKGIREGEWWYSWLAIDVGLEALRGDPRFPEMLRKRAEATRITRPSPLRASSGGTLLR